MNDPKQIEQADPELLSLITNAETPNNAPAKSKLRLAWERAQVQRMMQLIPTGKHRNQRGTKGAFGKPRAKVTK